MDNRFVSLDSDARANGTCTCVSCIIGKSL